MKRRRSRGLRRRYGHAAAQVVGHGVLQPGDPVTFRRSNGRIAYGSAIAFDGDRVQVFFCETPLTKWLPLTHVSKTSYDMMW